MNKYKHIRFASIFLIITFTSQQLVWVWPAHTHEVFNGLRPLAAGERGIVSALSKNGLGGIGKVTAKSALLGGWSIILAEGIADVDIWTVYLIVNGGLLGALAIAVLYKYFSPSARVKTYEKDIRSKIPRMRRSAIEGLARIASGTNKAARTMAVGVLLEALSYLVLEDEITALHAIGNANLEPEEANDVANRLSNARKRYGGIGLDKTYEDTMTKIGGPGIGIPIQEYRPVPIITISEGLNTFARVDIKEAVEDRDTPHIKKEVEREVAAGAECIEINVDACPEVGEVYWGRPSAMMYAVRRVAQWNQGRPIVVDSAHTDVLIAGLKAAKGKVIINSISPDTEGIEELIHLLEKNKAGVVLACRGQKTERGEHGMHMTAAERVEAAEKLMREIGDKIAPSDIFIDPAAGTLAEQAAVDNHRGLLVELEAALNIRARFPSVNITMSISNVSGGLPLRPMVNRVFLAMAMACGTNAPMFNVHDEKMRATQEAADIILEYWNEFDEMLKKGGTIPLSQGDLAEYISMLSPPFRARGAELINRTLIPIYIVKGSLRRDDSGWYSLSGAKYPQIDTNNKEFRSIMALSLAFIGQAEVTDYYPTETWMTLYEQILERVRQANGDISHEELIVGENFILSEVIGEKLDRLIELINETGAELPFGFKYNTAPDGTVELVDILLPDMSNYLFTLLENVSLIRRLRADLKTYDNITSEIEGLRQESDADMREAIIRLMRERDEFENAFYNIIDLSALLRPEELQKVAKRAGLSVDVTSSPYVSLAKARKLGMLRTMADPDMWDMVISPTSSLFNIDKVIRKVRQAGFFLGHTHPELEGNGEDEIFPSFPDLRLAREEPHLIISGNRRFGLFEVGDKALYFLRIEKSLSSEEKRVFVPLYAWLCLKFLHAHPTLSAELREMKETGTWMAGEFEKLLIGKVDPADEKVQQLYRYAVEISSAFEQEMEGVKYEDIFFILAVTSAYFDRIKEGKDTGRLFDEMRRMVKRYCSKSSAATSQNAANRTLYSSILRPRAFGEGRAGVAGPMDFLKGVSEVDRKAIPAMVSSILTLVYSTKKVLAGREYEDIFEKIEKRLLDYKSLKKEGHSTLYNIFLRNLRVVLHLVQRRWNMMGRQVRQSDGGRAFARIRAQLVDFCSMVQRTSRYLAQLEDAIKKNREERRKGLWKFHKELDHVKFNKIIPLFHRKVGAEILEFLRAGERLTYDCMAHWNRSLSRLADELMLIIRRKSAIMSQNGYKELC